MNPIHSSDPVDRMPSQSSQEQQKLFEIQFETAVLSDFVAITETNGSVGQQLSKLHNELAKGTPPDQLTLEVNHLISQINMSIEPGKAKFPNFQFSTESPQVEAISNYALSLQKIVQTAGEKEMITRPNEKTLCDDLSKLIANAAQMTTARALDQLNAIITQTNVHLPFSYQLPRLA